MRAQSAMSTVSNGTGLHTCVGEEEGFKRRAWGRGRGGGGEVEGTGIREGDLTWSTGSRL